MLQMWSVAGLVFKECIPHFSSIFVNLMKYLIKKNSSIFEHRRT